MALGLALKAALLVRPTVLPPRWAQLRGSLGEHGLALFHPNRFGCLPLHHEEACCSGHYREQSCCPFLHRPVPHRERTCCPAPCHG